MATRDILSEDELEALIDSVSSQPSNASLYTHSDECRTFDFASREQLLLSQMPALRLINEKLTLDFEHQLRRVFRFDLEVVSLEMRIVTLDEVMKSIPSHSGMSLVKLKPLPGMSLITQPAELLSNVVERYFGGAQNGSRRASISQELTPAEVRIHERILENFLAALRESWKDLLQLEVESVHFETHPDFIQMGSAQDVSVEFRFGLRVVDVDTYLTWVLPYTTLETLRTKLGNLQIFLPVEKRTENMGEALRQELYSVNLPLKAVLNQIQLPLRDVLNLKVGSIVPIALPELVKLNAENVPLFEAELGSFKGKKAVKLIRHCIDEK